MKKIVILGCSPAGVKAIEEIRAYDQESEITLISPEGNLPYNRHLFARLIAKEVSANQIFYRSKDFYVKNKVTLVLDKKITRINLKRNKIFTEEKIQFDYDVLILTDLPEHRFPELKGINKSGVFGCKRLKDIDEIIKSTLLLDTVAVQTNSLTGFQIACALAQKGNEAIVILPGAWFPLWDIEPEAMPFLIQWFEEKNVRIIQDNPIQEIFGDSDAKAVRLKSGKVLGASIVVLGDTREDFRVFADFPPQTNKRICVNSQFQTSFENAFALDQLCEFDGHQVDEGEFVPLAVLEDEGKVVAAKLNNATQTLAWPVLEHSFKFEGLSVHLIGQTTLKDGYQKYLKFSPESKTYKKIITDGQVLVGAVLINADEDREKWFNHIQLKTEIASFDPQMLEGFNSPAKMQALMQEADRAGS